MRLLRFFRPKAEQAGIKPSKQVVLNEDEERVFQRIKDEPVRLDKRTQVVRVSRDKFVEPGKGFVMPNGEEVNSLGELKGFVTELRDDEFRHFIKAKGGFLKQWISEQFEQPLLGARLAGAEERSEFIDALSHFLIPQVTVGELEEHYEEFNKRLEQVMHHMEDVRGAIQSARRQGVDTFISQTKLMNIKPKLDLAVVQKDELSLDKISEKLNEISEELKEEKRIHKEEVENAITR